MIGRPSQNGTAHPTFCQLVSLPGTLAKALLAPRALPLVVSGRSMVFQSLGVGKHRWESVGSTSLGIASWSDGGQQSRGCVGGQDAPPSVVFHRLLLWKSRVCRQGISIVASPSTVTGGVSGLCSTLRQAQDTALTFVAENVLRATRKCDTLDCAAFLFPLLAM